MGGALVKSSPLSKRVGFRKTPASKKYKVSSENKEEHGQVRDIISKKVKDIAERNAATRATDAPKLSESELNRLKNKDRALEEIRTKSPYLIHNTTFSLNLRWDMVYSTGERKVQKYEFQWMLDSTNSGDDDVKASNSVTAYSSLEDLPDVKEDIECTVNSWSNIPRSVVNEEKREVYIGGLEPLSGPFLFRVRSKNASGWSAWSMPSHPIKTASDSLEPPKAKLITPFVHNINWEQGNTWKPYGQVIYYKLLIKRKSKVSDPPVPLGFFSEEDFKEIYSGRDAELNIGRNEAYNARSNSILLAPRCTYVFQVICQTGISGSDKRYKSIYKSKPMSYECPTTVPQVPPQPQASSVSSTAVQMSWGTPSSDGGSPVILYNLKGVKFSEEGESEERIYYSGRECECILTAQKSKDKSNTIESIYPGFRYKFVLIAINELGESSPSKAINVRIPSIEEEREAKLEEENLERLRSGGTSISEEKVGGGGDNEENEELLAPSPKNIVNLPEGWQEYWDPKSEECFYYNVNTGENQWEHPGKIASTVENDSFSADELRWLKFRKKRFKFLHTLHNKAKNSQIADTDEVLKLRISRENFMYDSIESLQNLCTDDLRRKIRVIYKGEDGIDSGGLSKDWFLEMSRQLLSAEYGLFERSSSGVYQINPKSKMMSESSAYFKILGKLIAKALYDQQLIDAPFCSGLYKKIGGRSVNLQDLKQVDDVFAKSLEWMLHNDITDVIDQTFSVTVEEFGVHREVDLIPKGSYITVTEENKKKYINTLVQWKFGASVGPQLKAILEGIYDLIPPDLFSMFTHAELEMLINGKSEIDVNDIHEGCYKLTGGFSHQSKPVKLFWEAMHDFSDLDRGKVIRFITGSSKVPLDGFPPYAPFTITKSDELTKESLPLAHTCFNQLVLPNYENLQVLKEKLLYACENAGGFNLT